MVVRYSVHPRGTVDHQILKMSNDHKKGPGTHYSGNNPIPNIQRFIASLDADKKDRDENIERQRRDAQAPTGASHGSKATSAGKKGTRKMVTDPTTGNEVEIEDVNKEFLDDVKDPSVRSPSLREGAVELTFCN